MVEKQKKGLFICDKKPNLEMVFKRDQTAIIEGKILKTPAEYIRFIKTPYGGQFETSDPEKIAWMREQPQMAGDNPIIVEIDDIEALRAKGRKEGSKVHSGLLASAPRVPQAAVAEPVKVEPPKVAAAKVPAASDEEAGSSKRGRF